MSNVSTSRSSLMAWLLDPISWLDAVIKGLIIFGLYTGYIFASAYLNGNAVVVMERETPRKR